ncbi:glutathione S-transferase A-like [Ptychodera flava]|uniref:glutathione S-transferase A-like n=1 Tax=Ptychodera flava TaxID=63121 RepID=UPI00396A9C6C
MASEIFLYWGSGSGPCWRVMIALEEKGLSGYGNKLISFEKKEHKSEEILKLNPRGQVPTLKHGNIVINESMAGIFYLEDTFKGQGTELIPSDPAKKALVLQRTMESNNLGDKMRELMFYFFRNKDNIDEAKVGQLKAALKDEVLIWEGYLKELGGDSFIAGKDFTLADCCLFPIVAVLVRQGMDLDKSVPNLGKYYKTVKERPSAQASWPPHFKESPNQDRFKDVM